jgi:hypothetical protein
VTRLDRFPVHSSESKQELDSELEVELGVIGVFLGGTFIEDGEVASISFVSFEKIECDGLLGPESILRGESFKGDNDLFRSSRTKVSSTHMKGP